MQEKKSLYLKHLSEINLRSGACYTHYIIMKHYIVEWNFMHIYINIYININIKCSVYKTKIQILI